MTDSHAYGLAKAAAEKTSITAVASALGFSRPAISQYLNHCYGADPAQIEAAILTLYDVYSCTHSGIEISGPECRRRATAPRPFGGRAKEAHWLACQACSHNKYHGSKS